MSYMAIMSKVHALLGGFILSVCINTHAAVDTLMDMQVAELLVACEVLIFDRSPSIIILEKDISDLQKAHGIFMRHIEKSYSQNDFDSILDFMINKMVEHVATKRMKKLKDPYGFLNVCRRLPSMISETYR